MRTSILPLLQCPICATKLELLNLESNKSEVRRGVLSCHGSTKHTFEIEDGIMRFCSGFDHEAVKKELEYENTTYKGSDRLTDEKLIAQFPDTLAELWPHICNFGPDFRVLIEKLNLHPGAWVLDIGTGPCWSSRLLAQKGFNVIALDVNEANYYGLKTSDILFEAHNVFFERILESMTNLPLKNGVIDAITFNASFHHTPDMTKTLAECNRVLKPGGVIAMVNEEFASVRQKLINQGSETDTGSHHTVLYSEFEREIREAGFKPKFYVAHHVQDKLQTRYSSAIADVVVSTLETFPFLLKQLNSALILLTKETATGGRHTVTQSQTAQTTTRDSIAASASK
ncbi:MAG: class I SAM-dependent methyltransferase [Verrucomicrobia bacterium]|nr:class I SAM-dependent methyltransferase [Verrucomicrobiota bacterium]